MKSGTWSLWLAALAGAVIGIAGQIAYRYGYGDVSNIETSLLARLLIINALVWAFFGVALAVFRNSVKK